MPIPPDTEREFKATEYRVRLPQGGCAAIRIGEPLPRALHACVKNRRTPWGFITAWNPFARQASRALNRTRQRELLRTLRKRGAMMRAGVGVGTGKKKWREPSLFVTGLDFATLDALARRFEQAAIVRGVGHGEAELHALL
ncbi:MAG TPA: DUF3293 domain-containing protein [Rhodanobacteraceae bacterium]|nr:DUF3293 domain-containing protein [Rhodanobacteraceae bacterium]HEX5305435.1 DUF3293 domain-containing protein [Dyella sp.]